MYMYVMYVVTAINIYVPTFIYVILLTYIAHANMYDIYVMRTFR